VQSRKILGKTN